MIRLSILSILFVFNLHAADKVWSVPFQQVEMAKADLQDDPYYSIESVQVREVSEQELYNRGIDFDEELDKSGEIPAPMPVPPSTPTVTGMLDGVIMVVDKLVAIGEKIMPTIRQGKPVVTNNPMSAVSVIPNVDMKDLALNGMANWTLPKRQAYEVVYKNGLGIDIIKFVYSISFQHNGTYLGKGKYLNGVRVSARNIQVSWGFDLDADSKLIAIANVGTTENVVAGATVEITYTVKNVFKQITNIEAFHVSGDGRVTRVD